MIRPPNERRRLEALKLYQCLELGNAEGLQDIAMVAAQVMGTPTALVSLIEEHRQVYLGKVGTPLSEVPRDDSFCTHTILGTTVLTVVDATQDERFSSNPHVLKPDGVRFYAGTPVMSNDGEAIGTVCVVDSRPREINSDQKTLLMALARTAARLLEQARTAKELAESLAEVKAVQQLLPLCSSCKSVRSDKGYWSRLEDYLGSKSEFKVSTGMCPDCMKRLYPHFCDD